MNEHIYYKDSEGADKRHIYQALPLLSILKQCPTADRREAGSKLGGRGGVGFSTGGASFTKTEPLQFLPAAAENQQD